MNPYLLPSLYLTGAVACFIWVASDAQYRKIRQGRLTEKATNRLIGGIFLSIIWPVALIGAAAVAAGWSLWRAAGAPGRRIAAREDEQVRSLREQECSLIELRNATPQGEDRAMLTALVLQATENRRAAEARIARRSAL